MRSNICTHCIVTPPKLKVTNVCGVSMFPGSAAGWLFKMTGRKGTMQVLDVDVAGAGLPLSPLFEV